jgi:hypothetical protein
MLLQLNTDRPFDQTPPQLVDQPIRAGQLLRPLVLPEQLIDQLVRDLHVAHHGPPSGPSAGIAPTAATPRSSRPRRTNQSDTQKSAHYRRAFANGRLKNTKTRLSTRAVPLQAIALEALDRLPASENPILCPNSRGGHIDFRSFGRRHWKPAQIAAGIEPLRHLYDPRHTYATFALRAGVSVFAVSRFMGSSIAMIDRHYGHLARDSREHAVSLLDALALERAVDAGWTPPPRPAKPVSNRVSRPLRKRSRQAVDARWTSTRKTANRGNRRS